MLELSAARKNKVNLADYDWESDIQNRLLISDFSTFDIEVLEEILYSPLKITSKKLAKALDCDLSVLMKSLKRLSLTSLLEIKDESICVDKEKRKYFEFEINRFSPQFKPDMEFLQGLLRKVPIHLLPAWYAIPRASNNIFESIVEKYLLTPHIYQRYLMELNLGDAIIDSIIHDIFLSEELKISSTDLISKYNLKREHFEEILLILEFNFVCCLYYERQDDHWVEYVTPFYEWQEYLRYLRSTEAKPIFPKESIERVYESDFGFIEEMSSLLLKSRKKPQPVERNAAVEKLVLTKLADYAEEKLFCLEAGDAWLDLSLENRSLYLYRHPQNRLLSLSVTEKLIREAEKSIKRILHGNWVFFDDFLKGVLVPLGEDSVIMLKRLGKQWKYQLPVYKDQEMAIVRATIFEWLHELGMAAVGKCQGRDCICVTSFGKFFFSD